MCDEKLKHLEFIQNIITRMNTNSFQIKGLVITIVSALLAIYAATPKLLLIFLGIPPAFLFWFLDSYYLQQERKFRGVYNDVTGITGKIKVKLYAMPIKEYTKKLDKKYGYWNVFFSKTIFPLYFSIIVFLIALALLLKYKDLLIN
jgi:hypothetical protein